MENLLALKALGMEPEIFSFLLCLEDVPRSKPHPDVFQKIVEESGFSVEECIFVGDSLGKDILGAKGLGQLEDWEPMDGILVGEASDEALAWVPSIEDLPRLFIWERFQVVYLQGKSGVGYPHLKDTQEKRLLSFQGSGNELFLDPEKAKEMAQLLNSGVSPDELNLE
jgi:histidinol phosphatase-like enzyme